MGASELLRDGLQAAMAGAGGPIGSADRLCHACVDLLGVDGAAISFVRDGASSGTFGSSDESSRRWDELQFTLGEGPCLDAVRQGRFVLASDLADPTEQRWPAFSGALREEGVRAVFALPVRVAASWVGALDLFRRTAGSLASELWVGAEWASQLAALPLLDLMGADVDWEAIGAGGSWSQLESLERVEVYQATGMIQVQLDVGAAEALVRLRAYAFAHDMTASEAAWNVIERRLSFEPDDFRSDNLGSQGAGGVDLGGSGGVGGGSGGSGGVGGVGLGGSGGVGGVPGGVGGVPGGGDRRSGDQQRRGEGRGEGSGSGERSGGDQRSGDQQRHGEPGGDVQRRGGPRGGDPRRPDPGGDGPGVPGPPA